MPTAKKHVTDYTPDPGNANLGTERGGYMLEESLRQVGAGRSIVVDKNGIVIAGNKTLQGAVDSGIIDVVEVETQGDELVVVRRADLDLSDPDGRARLMAYFDNRASEVGLEWDLPQLLTDIRSGIDLSALFHDWEIENLFSSLEHIQDNQDTDSIWQGMPEFNQPDARPIRSIIVYFNNNGDIQEFSKLVGAKITEKTKFIYYPAQEIKKPSGKMVIDAS